MPGAASTSPIQNSVAIAGPKLQLLNGLRAFGISRGFTAASVVFLIAFLVVGDYRDEFAAFVRICFARQRSSFSVEHFSSEAQAPIEHKLSPTKGGFENGFTTVQFRFRPDRTINDYMYVFQTAPGDEGISMGLSGGAAAVFFRDSNGKPFLAVDRNCAPGQWHSVRISALDHEYVRVQFDSEKPQFSESIEPHFILSDLKIGTGTYPDKTFAGKLEAAHFEIGQARSQQFGKAFYWLIRSLLFGSFAVFAFAAYKRRPIVVDTEAIPLPESQAARPWYFDGPALVLYVVALKVVLQLLLAGRYGYFSDELYYLACSEHLGWGYVDQPPLIAVITKFARAVTGDSLLSLRLLPALAGGALVWLVGAITRQLGGDRFAQFLAALAVLAAPVYMVFHYLLTMNAFDPLLWMSCAYVTVLAIKYDRPEYWLWFGLLLGIGMENKYDIAYFALAIAFGLLLTPWRKFLASRYMWMGVAVALLVFLPNLVWLVQHHFPFFEWQRETKATKRLIELSELDFLLHQVWLTGLTCVLWLPAGWFFFRSARGRRYRVLGWALVIPVLMFMVAGKDYYPFPVYGIAFAAGAVAVEKLTAPTRLRWVRGAVVACILVAGAVLAPTFVPILPIEQVPRYMSLLHLSPPFTGDKVYADATLSPVFSAQFDTEEMTALVAEVYDSLPPAERSNTAILAKDYVRAGAIDWFGPKYGLPKAISGHMSYYFWGPRSYPGNRVIAIGYALDDPKVQSCIIPNINQPRWGPVLVCPTGLGLDFQTDWPKLKNFVN